tara:strand:+ start:701 stop:1198 length:498 start_codon:yes stop_codon:yes gene_type:complete
MTIIVKNKETLLFDEFKIKCSIGKNGTSIKKREGDYTSPRGTFDLGNIYYRAGKLQKPISKLKCIKIKKNMGWCDDPKSKNYNKLIRIKKNLSVSYEKLYRNDYKYDLLIPIKYNYKKVVKNKGSAIFLHLTKNYFPTKGCIALKKKDFLILCKLIKKTTKIKIN